jgi:hypothetical protein
MPAEPIWVSGLVVFMEHIDEQRITNMSENYPDLEIVPKH